MAQCPFHSRAREHMAINININLRVKPLKREQLEVLMERTVMGVN